MKNNDFDFIKNRFAALKNNIIKTAGTYRNLSFIIAFPSLVCKASSHKAKKFFPIIKLIF